jgi:hypothetical protein
LLLLAEDHPAEVANNPRLLHNLTVLEKAELHAVLALAACTSAPGPLLDRLAQHPRAEVRATVAQNGSTPTGSLRLLAFDEDSEVRETALQRDTTGELRALFEELRTFKLWEIRWWLSQDPSFLPSTSCPLPLRRFLIRHGGPRMHQLLAHPSCHESIAQEALAIWLQGRPSVLLAAQQYGFLKQRTASTWTIEVQLARFLVKFAPVDGAFLNLLFSPQVRFVHSFLLSMPSNELLRLLDVTFPHPAFSLTTLEVLSKHRFSQLRIEALRHPDASGDWLPRMLGDPCYPVRREAWNHPRLPASWQERLLRLGFPPGLATRPESIKIKPDDRMALLACGPWLKSLV